MSRNVCHFYSVPLTAYFVLCIFSMYWYQWSSICTVESGSSLSESQGSICQLHLRGWKFGTDVVTGRTFGPKFFATHTRSDRIRVNHSCRCQQNCVASTTNHPGTNSIQISRQRRRVFVTGYVIKNEQSRIASSQR